MYTHRHILSIREYIYVFIYCIRLCMYIYRYMYKWDIDFVFLIIVIIIVVIIIIGIVIVVIVIENRNILPILYITHNNKLARIKIPQYNTNSSVYFSLNEIIPQQITPSHSPTQQTQNLNPQIPTQTIPIKNKSHKDEHSRFGRSFSESMNTT